MTGTGNYRGHKEKCFIVSHGECHYPYTKNGKVSRGRIRNAMARAAQQGKIAAIKRGGFCRIARANGIKSEHCR